MRPLTHIVGWVAIAFSVGWSFYDWIFVDEGLAYFAADWRRVLLLAFISITGGLAVLGFMRLPTAVRLRLTAILLAVCTLGWTWCGGYSIWQLVRLRLWLTDMGEAFWLLAGLGLGSAAMLAFVWFSFCRYWRKTYGHGNAA
jgi:hypothetical protein